MVALIILLAAGSASASEACAPCHRDIVDSYRQTAHSRSSSRADPTTIRGSFSTGSNILHTHDFDVWFRMERKGDSFFQTAHDHGRIRSERFDLVMGSGRRGQSYLFFKNSVIYQLPVSFSALAGGWVNSPGYIDGKVFFDRTIEPSCIECHATLNGPQLLGGLLCQKCHGTAQNHSGLRNPARFDRTAKIGLCGQCHSGLDKNPKADVHGNQVGLLQSSKCFQRSESMTCTTCHNIHKVERDLAALSRKCISCHDASKCKRAAASTNCIDCHMPLQNSQVIVFQRSGKPLAQTYRTHAIGIY